MSEFAKLAAGYMLVTLYLCEFCVLFCDTAQDNTSLQVLHVSHAPRSLQPVCICELWCWTFTVKRFFENMTCHKSMVLPSNQEEIGGPTHIIMTSTLPPTIMPSIIQIGFLVHFLLRQMHWSGFLCLGVLVFGDLGFQYIHCCILVFGVHD